MTTSDVGKIDVQHFCKLAGVSGELLSRFETRARVKPTLELTSHIQLLSLRHRFYGYRRITAVLRRSGLVINAKRVQRLMREDNLIAMRRKPFAPPPRTAATAFLSCPICCGPGAFGRPDLGGGYYLHSPARGLRLSRRHSRRLLAQSRGLALAPHLDASLAMEALDRALADRKPRPASLIHHSDRGVQYALNDYRQRLAGHDITVSMSRPGNLTTMPKLRAS